MIINVQAALSCIIVNLRDFFLRIHQQFLKVRRLCHGKCLKMAVQFRWFHTHVLKR